jgi:hypothetical protein
MTNRIMKPCLLHVCMYVHMYMDEITDFLEKVVVCTTMTRSQSYDFLIYFYNASVAVGWSNFFNSLGYS